ncbi:hypothetical protein BCR39DRAFT_62997 [Naematelia encephala]|uniref:Uncharacterized protein n=1 Tax=Naematelia encephala TaxID=71784 RepID=A0A1Y2AFZ9_9TREE|nr:hypothetical protein BCR39DRAFT_62997 [Naematelia encephala]
MPRARKVDAKNADGRPAQEGGGSSSTAKRSSFIDHDRSRPQRSVEDLPTLSSIVPLPHTATSLLRPFSLFGLFRTSSPLHTQPSPQLIHELALSRTPPVSKEIRNALSGLSEYVQHLVTAAHAGDDGRSLASRTISELGTTYAEAFWIISSLPDVERAEWIDTFRECLQGVFVTLGMLAQDDPGRDQIDQILLGSIFPSDTARPAHMLLTPLFALAQGFTNRLQASVRAQVKSKIRPASRESQYVVSDKEAQEILSLLEMFGEEMSLIDSLPPKSPIGKTCKVAMKRLAIEGRKRARRVEMEATVLGTEVALSMVTTHMSEIKRRAHPLHGDDESPFISKRALSPHGDDESPADAISLTPPGWSSPEGWTEDNDVLWEDLADESLIHALTRARAVLAAKLPTALTDPIQADEWLDGPHSLSHLPGSPSSLHPDDSVSNAPTPSISASSSSSVSSSSDEEEDQGPTHACPLRALFRLHDRYEEQRLAVWLGLPQWARPGMGTYMRGKQGKVGDAWDSLGTALVMSFESATLLSFGLSADKMDKWVEMAARRNSKRGGY